MKLVLDKMVSVELLKSEPVGWTVPIDDSKDPATYLDLAQRGKYKCWVKSDLEGQSREIAWA